MIRQALIEDIPELLRVFNAAKQYMRDSGNPNQWGPSYPPLEDLRAEINEKFIYVLEDETGHIYGTFLLMDIPEPTYEYIEGEWLDNTPYGTIHRVASDGSVKGVFNELISFSKEKFSHLRIDTHKDNLTMQHVVDKHGFKYCGIIYLANKDARLAYEWS